MVAAYLKIVLLFASIFLYAVLPAKANSTDIAIELYPGNPVLKYSGAGFDATRVENPTVIKVDSIYYMFYGGAAVW